MLRVTFDSNVWEHVVDWERYGGDDQPARKAISDAIRDGIISCYISERILVVEALRKNSRAKEYMDLANDYLSVETKAVGGGMIELSISFQNVSDRHPGAHPVLIDRLHRATELGFKVLPDMFFGSTRPVEPDLSPYYAGPESYAGRTLDEILTEDQAVSAEITARGAGRGRIEEIGKRIRRRLSLSDGAWFDGLDRPKDSHEAREIAAAFSEMVDADVVAAHIAYRFDILCTNDRGRNRPSIFDEANRQWLAERYGTIILSPTELAEHISMQA